MMNPMISSTTLTRPQYSGTLGMIKGDFKCLLQIASRRSGTSPAQPSPAQRTYVDTKDNPADDTSRGIDGPTKSRKKLETYCLRGPHI